MELLNPNGIGVNKSKFGFEQELFRRARIKKILNRKIKACRKCSELNLGGVTESAPGWGNPFANVMLVGQSLCTQCMATQIPFTEKSGYYIDVALRLSGITRRDVFITNVIHCHPAGNRASTAEETANCLDYLFEEVKLVEPKLIVALGRPAQKSIASCLYLFKRKPKIKIFNCYHPASFLYSGNASALKNWICDLSMEMDKCLKEAK